MEEGVRVELLKLDTEGSRPIGEMSDNYNKDGTNEVQQQNNGVHNPQGPPVSAPSALGSQAWSLLYFLPLLCFPFPLH